MGLDSGFRGLSVRSTKAPKRDVGKMGIEWKRIWIARRKMALMAYVEAYREQLQEGY